MTDIPECEDMHLIKSRTQTSSQCHKCFVKSDDFYMDKVRVRKKLEDILTLLRLLKDESSEAQLKLQHSFMLPIAPVLSTLLFIGAERSVRLYAIFLLKAQHSFSLGISKLLKECLSLYVSVSTRCISAMNYESALPKPYDQMQKTVLNIKKEFLKHAKAEAMGFGQRINHSKGETGGKEHFLDSGVIVILE